MIKQSSEGIIVRSFLSGENSLVLRIITPDFGKVVLYASHAKKSKRRFGSLDIFDCGNFIYQEKDNALGSLVEFKSISSFPGMRDTHEQLSCASLLAEIIDLITAESDPNSSDNYLVLKNGFEKLSQIKETRGLLKTTYEVIYQIATNSGFVEMSEVATASAKNLKKILTKLEYQTQHRFVMADEVFGLVRKLSAG